MNADMNTKRTRKFGLDDPWHFLEGLYELPNKVELWTCNVKLFLDCCNGNHNGIGH